MTDKQQLGMFDGVEDDHGVLTPDQIFASLDQRVIVEATEDDRIERKPAQFAGAEIGKYVSMWANTEPDGEILVLGVLDDGRIEGVKRLGTEGVNKILKAPGVFAPDARCRTKRVQVTNHRGERDFVVAIRVYYHETRLVRDSKGNAYLRSGDSKKKLRQAEAAEISAEKGERSFGKEPCSFDFPDDFDTRSMADFVKHVRRVKGWSAELTDLEVLEVRAEYRLRPAFRT